MLKDADEKAKLVAQAKRANAAENDVQFAAANMAMVDGVVQFLDDAKEAADLMKEAGNISVSGRHEKNPAWVNIQTRVPANQHFSSLPYEALQQLKWGGKDVGGVESQEVSTVGGRSVYGDAFERGASGSQPNHVLVTPQVRDDHPEVSRGSMAESTTSASAAQEGVFPKRQE